MNGGGGTVALSSQSRRNNKVIVRAKQIASAQFDRQSNRIPEISGSTAYQSRNNNKMHHNNPTEYYTPSSEPPFSIVGGGREQLSSLKGGEIKNMESYSCTQASSSLTQPFSHNLPQVAAEYQHYHQPRENENIQSSNRHTDPLVTAGNFFPGGGCGELTSN